MKSLVEFLEENKLWLKSITLLVAVFSLIWISTQGFQRLHESIYGAIKPVVAEQNLQLIQPADVYSFLENESLGSFFDLSLMEAQEKLKSVPWASNVHLRKQWPNKLLIDYEEHSPIARWNETHWVSDQGVLFQAPALGALESLPRFDFAAPYSQHIMETFRKIKTSLNEHDLKLVHVSADQRDSWWIRLSSGLTIYLGRDKKIARLERFLIFYKQLATDLAYSDYVDLRYDSGLVLGRNAMKKEI